MVLAYPLLWAAMSPLLEGRMDELQRNRIREAYKEIDTLPDGVNPVVRVHLRVGKVKNNLVIVETQPEVIPGVAAAATTEQGVLPNTGVSTAGGVTTAQPTTAAPGLDQNVIKDMLYLQHQQTVRMLNNHATSQQAALAGLRLYVENRFDKYHRTMTK